MTADFPWHQKYAEALLEVSPQDLPRRIDAAQRAIEQRLQELGYSGISREEQAAIHDASRRLRVLARTEGQPQQIAQSGLVQDGSA